MAPQMDTKLLTELVCTRLSHDIVGNIGAVSNAVELLEEGDMDFIDDIKSILKTSSHVLSARMKFFRMAFGLNNASLENMEVLKDTIEAYLSTIGNRNYPLQLEFNLQNSTFARTALLAVMIIADVMIRGGTISVTEKEGKLIVSSEGSTPPPAEKLTQIRDTLSGEFTELNAQFAPVFYLRNLLAEEKRNLYIINSDFLGFMFE